MVPISISCPCPKASFSVRRSRLTAFSCLSPSTWPDLHFGNQATARGALGPDVIEDECGDEEIRRQSLVLLGEILVETVDQADERYAKGAPYTASASGAALSPRSSMASLE